LAWPLVRLAGGRIMGLRAKKWAKGDGRWAMEKPLAIAISYQPSAIALGNCP